MCHDMRGFNENSSVKTIQADMQPRIKAKGNHNTEGRPNDESITSETHKRRGEPNKQPILSISVRVCVCVFACLSRGNDSHASHTLLCQIDGSIGMPPVSLKTCTALRDGALGKEWERKNKREHNRRCQSLPVIGKYCAFFSISD